MVAPAPQPLMAEGFLHDGLVLASVLRRGRPEERLGIVLRGAFLDALAVLDVRADADGRGDAALGHVRDAVAEPGFACSAEWFTRWITSLRSQRRVYTGLP